MKKTNSINLLAGVFISIALFSCTSEDDLLNPQEDRDAFIGSWNVTDSCSKDAYSVNIIKDPSNSSQVIIENFWLIGYNEKAPYAIIAGTTMTIPQQNMCNNDANEVSGNGKLEKKIIKLNYTVNDGADLWTCKANYEKP
jgi:hypothetical protein